MDSLTSGLCGIVSGIGKSSDDTVDHGAKEAGLGDTQDHASIRKDTHSAKRSNNLYHNPSGSASGTVPHAAAADQHGSLAGVILNSITSGITSEASLFFSPSADALKSGASLAHDAAVDGLSIGQKIAKSGLDMGSNVVTGMETEGTALGGVVKAAAETSGAVFQPVGSGLKTIEGLGKLGQDMDAINGLAMGAISQVILMTTKALNMSGKTPTFFDQDVDHIVSVPDTVRGLVLLGLPERYANYAAYALHAVFSYPTSDNWLPGLSKAMPIHIAKMDRTCWGKNWGTYERIDWVDDVEIDEFFGDHKDEKAWSEYAKEGRQGFGVLLLLFEWGTTWPFYIPSVPVHEIPFSNNIGLVVRKAILPTIILNFKKSRAGKPRSKMPDAK